MDAPGRVIIEGGRSPAKAWITFAAEGLRLRIISRDGSTAVTFRSMGSYEPVPAPTFRNRLRHAERRMDRDGNAAGRRLAKLRVVDPDGVVFRGHSHVSPMR